MRVLLGRFDVAVAENGGDEGERETARDAKAREGVAQVVEPDVWQAGGGLCGCTAPSAVIIPQKARSRD